MSDREWFERRLRAENLRREAEADQRRADEEDGSYADYLQARAAHKRWLANNEDGGYGQ